MKPIPIVFNLGPLQIHTYGIGLAITFYVAYKLFERRLKAHNFDTEWLTNAFIWIVIAAVVGARIVHLIANFSYYKANPSEIYKIWHGGLSSYGGLLGGLISGIYIVRKKCPVLKLGNALDLIAPVLMVSWAIGRLLGPQLMTSGGGRRTNAWYGMYYANQLGKRLPVPVFQAIECFIIYIIILQIEKKLQKGPLFALALWAVILWDISRFFDEFLYLDRPQRLWDAVEVASLVLVVTASITLIFITRKWKRNGSVQVERNFQPQENDLQNGENSDITDQNSEAEDAAAEDTATEGPYSNNQISLNEDTEESTKIESDIDNTSQPA